MLQKQKRVPLLLGQVNNIFICFFCIVITLGGTSEIVSSFLGSQSPVTRY